MCVGIKHAAPYSNVLQMQHAAPDTPEHKGQPHVRLLLRLPIVCSDAAPYSNVLQMQHLTTLHTKGRLILTLQISFWALDSMCCRCGMCHNLHLSVHAADVAFVQVLLM